VSFGAEITEQDKAAAVSFWRRYGTALLNRLLNAEPLVKREVGDMQTGRQPRLVRLKAEYAELYKGKLEVGRDYQGLFSPYRPDFMSIMGSTVDRADRRHFEIVNGE
jgi:hypothetical protein